MLRVSMGIDTKSNTLCGRAPQAGDLRLLEDGGERRGALVSNVVAVETADEGGAEMVRDSKRVNALTRRRTLGRGRT